MSNCDEGDRGGGGGGGGGARGGYQAMQTKDGRQCS